MDRRVATGLSYNSGLPGFEVEMGKGNGLCRYPLPKSLESTNLRNEGKASGLLRKPKTR